MSPWLSAPAGLALGALAGWAHLGLARWRAGLAVRRGAASALVTYPLALVCVALSVLAAAELAPLAAWCTLPGLVAVRLVLLRRQAVRP